MRRSSTRSIKRKKFDDELVESSLVKSERGRLRGPLEMRSTPDVMEPAATQAAPEKKKVRV